MPPQTNQNTQPQTPTPAVKPEEKAEKKTEMVDVVLYPAFKVVTDYCDAKKIAYMTGKRTRTKVKATVPKADYEALQKKLKGCVSLA